MIHLHVEPGAAAASALTDVKALSWKHPGEQRLTIHVAGRELTLGPEWSYDDSPELVAALEDFGRVEVTA